MNYNCYFCNQKANEFVDEAGLLEVNCTQCAETHELLSVKSTYRYIPAFTDHLSDIDPAKPIRVMITVRSPDYIPYTVTLKTHKGPKETTVYHEGKLYLFRLNVQDNTFTIGELMPLDNVHQILGETAGISSINLQNIKQKLKTYILFS